MKSTVISFAAATHLPRLPDFSARYEVIEYLAGGERSETFVVRSRASGEYLLAKLYDKPSGSGGEDAILAQLDHPAIPRPVETIRSAGMTCVIRDYVEGLPLDQMALPLDAGRALDIGAQLCGILTYLHSRTPPVIHRDVKPQNVIVDDEDKIHLIDFGISRRLSGDAPKDTALVVTEGYAPPEQYGFKQTDCRADIYSLGVLLCFLLTGEHELSALDRLSNRRLARVLRKCAAFAPEDRYPTADAVKRALLGSVKKRTRSWIAAALVPLAVAAALLAWPSQEEEMLPDIDASAPPVSEGLPPVKEGIVFAEPLIEQAVRFQLGLDDGAEIRKNELFSITHLFICADRAFAEFDGPDGFDSYRGAMYQGLVIRDPSVPPMTTLEDLAMLPSLIRIWIHYQQITDLKPLTSIEFLKSVDISHNPVEDLSPLAEIQTLTDVFLHGVPFLDISPLAELPHLSKLGFSNHSSFDLRPLRELRGLELLHAHTSMETWKYLPDSPLQNLHISGFADSFQWLAPYTSSLQELRICWSELNSLEGIEEFTELQILGIDHTEVTDLTPLFLLPNLKEVQVDPSMLDVVEAVRDRAGFTFTVEDATPAANRVAFAEPLIEQAVRQSLGLDDGAEIPESGLYMVTELIISADRIFDNLDDLYNYKNDVANGLVSRDPSVPPITTLEDLAMLPSLRHVYISFQQITDLSPLASLEFLEELDLEENPIEDLSPLAELKNLRCAFLYRLPFKDLSPLTALPNLNSLNIDNRTVFDLSPLRELRSLELLHIFTDMEHWKYLPDSPLRDYRSWGTDSLERLAPYKSSLEVLWLHGFQQNSLKGIEEFTLLEELDIRLTEITDLTPLLALPNLKEVYIESSLLDAADAIRDKAAFAIVVVE